MTHGYAGDGPDGWWSSGAEPFRSLVERVPAVLYVDRSDEASSALYVNPQGESLLGYSREEWLDDPELWAKILHPGDRERVLAEHLRARREGDAFEAEYRLFARDGSVVWVRDEAVPVDNDDGGPGCRAGVLLDITERKLYEEKLRRSEERFRLVARVTGEAIWDNDLFTGVQVWDGATEALFGYPSRRRRTGRWWEERIHPDDRRRVLSGLAPVLERGEAWESEYRFRRADGSYARVLDRGRVVRDGKGTPVRMVGAMADVTERREHEQELGRREELFRMTFEAAAVGMAHIAPDGRWLRFNDKLCEISGYPREELLDLGYQDLALPGELEPDKQRAGRLLSGEIDSYAVERRCVRKDGRCVWLKLSLSLARKAVSGEPDYLVCVAEDVTARKLAELVPEPLTDRELAVLRLVAAGLKNRQIAEEVAHSLGTVKQDVRSILTKLGVQDRRRAVARAVEIGLVSPSGALQAF